MRMPLKLIASFCLIVLPFTQIHAQTFDFIEGYYISNDGQRKDGLIRDESIRRQSKGIHFKESDKSKAQFIPVSELKSVHPSEGFSLISLYDSAAGKKLLKTRICDGRIKLDGAYDNKSILYTFTKGELTKTVYPKKYNPNNWEFNQVKDIRYRGVLKIFMQDSKKSLERIPDTKFGYRGFKNIVDKYNRLYDKSYFPKKRKIKVQIGPYIGIKFNQNKYAYYTLYNGQVSNREPGITGGAVANIRVDKRVRFNTGLIYTQFRAQFPEEVSLGFGPTYSADIKFSFIDLPVKIDYLILDRDLKLGLSLGYTLAFITKSEFLITNTSVPETTEADFPIKSRLEPNLGVILEFKKYFFNCNVYRGFGRDDGVNSLLKYNGLEIGFGIWLLQNSR